MPIVDARIREIFNHKTTSWTKLVQPQILVPELPAGMDDRSTKLPPRVGQ
jgi:hypothetical protein